MKSLGFIFLSLVGAFAVQAQADLSIYKFRSLGPDRGGRVTAVAGTVAQDGLFFLGATGGGVWRSTDYGTTWENVSDGFFETPSIGAITIDQKDPNIIYVGTGSDGLRSNVILGKGMYKSVDGGDSWTAIGLSKVGQIGEVVIHPSNYNVVYVSAIGNPFGPNPERGIYKTMDGGLTWDKILYVSETVGFYDVEMLPGNPEVLFATAWKAERKPWTIISGGSSAEGGIYKSVNGGKAWAKITEGLPSGLIGKIDVGLTPADSKVVYALIEAPGDEGGMYRSNDQGKSFEQVSSDGGIRTRPFYYTNVKVDPKNSDKLYVMATGYFRSDDGGKNWTRMRPPHGDNHDMWIHPNRPDLFIQSNDGGANVTFNGGKTWSSQFNQPTAEIYQVEVDDQYPYWLYGGQQDNYSTIAVPSLAPDGRQGNRSAYIINTGGCETGPAVPKPGNSDLVYANCKGRFSVFDKSTGTEASYDVGAYFMYGHNPSELPYRFQRVSPIHVSPHNPDVVYHTSQFVHKTTDDGVTWETISPDLTAFEPSKQVISGSPITRDITGEEFYSTIYAIRESPVQAGVIWVGANDGPVHVTTDGGDNWSNVTPSKLLPGGRVDAVEPSPHDAQKAYFSVLRYQLGDFRPYIYRTMDNGKKWELLTDGSNGIPIDYPVKVIREDPVVPGLLYAGTEYGLFISMDDGSSWSPFQEGLPVTPITDIKLVKEDLVVSTMGRGFYVVDDLTSLRQQTVTKTNGVKLFEPRTNIRYRYPSTGARGAYPSSVTFIDYYLPETYESAILEILDADGNKVNGYYSGKIATADTVDDMRLSSTQLLKSTELEINDGIHRFVWDMRNSGPWNSNEKRSYRGGPMAAPGNYLIRLTVDGMTYEQQMELVSDPRQAEIGIDDEEIISQVDFALMVRDLLTKIRELEEQIAKELEMAEGERLEKLTAANDKLKTKEGTYMKPMLVSQVSYLYNLSTGSDRKPGGDALLRLAELVSQVAEVEASIN
jgi:photosystem II stability/assembly factor-like uncharacterized protein